MRIALLSDWLRVRIHIGSMSLRNELHTSPSGNRRFLSTSPLRSARWTVGTHADQQFIPSNSLTGTVTSLAATSVAALKVL